MTSSAVAAAPTPPARPSPPRRRWPGRVARFLGWTLVTLLLAITVIPRFLDRIYYTGPVSDHFNGERFQNPTDATNLPPFRMRGGIRGWIWRSITGNDGRPVWPDAVPVKPVQPKTLPALQPGDMRATWVGHATVLIETPGFTVLTDPIWSKRAGPFGGGPARVVPPAVAIADLPKIDLIVVSHNHYDHMDLSTLKALWERDRPDIVTSLGNDTILRSHGIASRAMDWGQSSPVIRPACVAKAADKAATKDAACFAPGTVRVTRNQHWGSRWGVDSRRALWSSFVIETPSGSVFFAGDTGPGDMRWPQEAARLASGPIRYAILPIGAFRFSDGQDVTSSHIGPQHAAAIYEQLGASSGLAIHWGTFRLSWEGYDTPRQHLTQLAACRGAGQDGFHADPVGTVRMVPPLPPTPRAPSDFDTAKFDAAQKCLLASEAYKRHR